MAQEETTTTENNNASAAEEEIESPATEEIKGSGLRFKKSKGVCRKCRRAGEKLFLKGERCFSAKCSFTRRSYAPGQHGNKGQARLSQYGLQLREKQKLAAIYNIRERQLLKYFAQALAKKGKTGDKLMQTLEQRLDNVIYRAGFATSRREARQLINTRRVILNEDKVNIPSIQVKAGDIIKISQEKKQKEKKDAREKSDVPQWLSLNKKNDQIKVIRLPGRDDITEPIDELLVVEFYSK